MVSVRSVQSSGVQPGWGTAFRLIWALRASTLARRYATPEPALFS